MAGEEEGGEECVGRAQCIVGDKGRIAWVTFSGDRKTSRAL